MPIINTIIKDKTPVVEPLPVTPSSSAQTITVPANIDGYTPINVSAVTSSVDQNIVAGNIKNGVTILGVTGNYTGSAGPTYYIEKTKDVNNKLVNGSAFINLTNVTTINDYCLYSAYKNASLSGAIDLSNITTIRASGLGYCFYECLGITSVDLRNLTTLNSRSLDYAFYGCSNLSSVNLSSFTGVAGDGAFSYAFAYTGLTSVDLSAVVTPTSNSMFHYAFSYCPSLTTVNLHNLVTIGYFQFNSAFRNCTSLTNVDLTKLKNITGYSGANSMFLGDTSLQTIVLDSLETINEYQAAAYMFSSCTSLSSASMRSLKYVKGNGATTQMFGNTALTSLSFPSLTVNSFDTNVQFINMLYGVTGCTVHFPMAIQSTIGSWSSITDGMGGTNTTILFDIVTSLTGADTLVYTRREKDSTSSAIAWENNGALYYTSGTTDPAVGDTIYGDDTCTTAVTTIAAIA